jgi:uncharacterized surface protein with fasciclin (FAS1) repeats
MRTLMTLTLALGLAVSLMPAAPAAEEKDIVDIAASNKDFSTLVKAVQAAGLVETLKGTGPFTVLAPTNAAFEKVEGLDAIIKDKAKLTEILKAHVVAGKAMSKDVVKLPAVKTLSGTFPVKVDGASVMIGNAKVVKADIEASNGVIHVIDTVLIPE